MPIATGWPRRRTVVLLAALAVCVCYLDRVNLSVAIIPIHMDIAPRHAGTLMGLTNTAGTIPGVVGVYVSGLILQATGSWTLVFQVSAGVAFAGLIVFVLFSSGRKLFD